MTKQKEKKILKAWVIIILGMVIVVLIAILSGKFFFKTYKNNDKIHSTSIKVFENQTIFPAMGPNNANHTVIEFSDFQCPYCGIASGLPEWTEEYQTKYPSLFGLEKKIKDLAKQGKIRFIYVPVSFLGPESVYATQATLCANKQGKFWELHNLLFSSQTLKENDGEYSKENLKILGGHIENLNMAKFNSCLDNDETLLYIKEISSIAKRFVKATPTFYVDGQKVSASWPQISNLLD